MDTNSTEDTVPSPAVRAASLSPLGRFVRSVPGAALILIVVISAVLALAAAAGYTAGKSDRDRAAATAQFVELNRQYQLGLEDMDAGRHTLAIQRFEFILALDPDFPNAADRLAEARAASSPETATPALPTPTPIITVGPQTAQTLFGEAEAAYNSGDWETTLQKLNALRVIDPEHERVAVRKMLFDSLRNRGIDHINAGKLELGLIDLDQASKIGALDAEAQQYQQWATIYITGVSYWGLNWPRTIETFTVLHTIAPYFRDTITRLRDAHLAYASQLDSAGDPCNAVTHYVAALELRAEAAVEEKRLAAETACQFGTPTPDGTLTPFAIPGGTGTPTLEASATPTDTPIPGPTATPTATHSPTNTETPTISPTPTETPTATPAS
jgi:tetratricopeptide (TPR) repeat protein